MRDARKSREPSASYAVDVADIDCMMATIMNSDDRLNILEQRPSWSRLTTNVAWCFEQPGNVESPKLVNVLQNGLDRLVESFPWIAGQVINEGQDAAKGDTGIYRIVPRVIKPSIIVKDHRNAQSVPDIGMLRRAGFATQLLDESIFAPRPTLALQPGEVNAVLLVQVNIIKDGLVLVFSGNHSAMDMPGQTQVIRWFHMACCGKTFNNEDLEVGNMPRRDLVPLLDLAYQPGDELLQQTPLDSVLTAPKYQTNGAVKLRWATFLFPSRSVTALKSAANACCTSAYVSTDDTLSALLWQSIARSRLHRLSSDDVCTAGRAANVRSALGIPSTYPGLAQNTLYQKLSFGELANLSLGAVASILRDTVTSTSPTVSLYTRSLATALSRSPNKGFLKIIARMDLTKDVLLTSHAARGAYDLNFSLGLGAAEAVRVTRLVEVEGLTYLLPARPNGDMALTSCLREEDLEHLMVDSMLSQYAQHLA